MSKTEHEAEIIGMLEQLREDLRPLGNAKGELYFGIDALLRELAFLTFMTSISPRRSAPRGPPVKLSGCAPAFDWPTR